MLLVKSTPEKKLLPVMTHTLQGAVCCPGLVLLQLSKGVHRCHAKHVALVLKLLPTFYDLKKSNECCTFLLHSRKFLSSKSFVTSDRLAVRQEFIFGKCRSSLVFSTIVRSSLFCLSFIFPFMKAFLIEHLWLLKKIVRNLV